MQKCLNPSREAQTRRDMLPRRGPLCFGVFVLDIALVLIRPLIFLGLSACFSHLGALPPFLSVSGPFVFGSSIVSTSYLSTEFQFFLADFGMESNRQCRVLGELLWGKKQVHPWLWTAPLLSSCNHSEVFRMKRSNRVAAACLPPALCSFLASPTEQRCCAALALAQPGLKFIQVQLMSSFKLTKAEDGAWEALWPQNLGPWKLQAVCRRCLLMRTCSREMLVNFSRLRGDPGLIKRINGFELKVLAVSSR